MPCYPQRLRIDPVNRNNVELVYTRYGLRERVAALRVKPVDMPTQMNSTARLAMRPVWAVMIVRLEDMRPIEPARTPAATTAHEIAFIRGWCGGFS